MNLRVLLLILLVGASPAVAHAAEPPVTFLKDPRHELPPIRTLLITSEVSTWLDLPAPPYNAPVTVKTKWQRAEFDVVLDPQAPHDARVVIHYQETPGRQYQRLERATNITCRIVLEHEGIGQVLALDFEASTGAVPVGNLYWDAVQHLEENPYYYYLGDLIRGWLTAQEEPGVVFSNMLRKPAMTFSVDGGGSQPSDEVMANQEARINAIRELGRLRDRRALEVLWTLARQPEARPRLAAIEAIGEIGDPESVEPLTRLRSEEDPEVRSTVEAALKRIQGRQ